MNDVYIAIHRYDDPECYRDADVQILGVFTTEKEAAKLAKGWKRNFRFRGKEAKWHSFVVEAWAVNDKISENQLYGVKR